ncbi:hypothetical protein JW933_02140 [candidate division FCPU426 bacterium]|nr:hypothetical protein [candidate division FCPU426 bacterium]
MKIFWLMPLALGLGMFLLSGCGSKEMDTMNESAYQEQIEQLSSPAGVDREDPSGIKKRREEMQRLKKEVEKEVEKEEPTAF